MISNLQFLFYINKFILFFYFSFYTDNGHLKYFLEDCNKLIHIANLFDLEEDKENEEKLILK